MEPTSTTLKDIARELGVSAATVHRALSGTGRVSEKTREKVLQLASDKGYRSNYVAASLKRQKLCFAIVLPEPVNEEKYYYSAIWSGIRSYLNTVQGFNIQPLEYSYSMTSHKTNDSLKDIYENHLDKIDGILTINHDDSHCAFYMEKLAESAVPIVTVGMDSHRKSKFCSIRSRNDMAGCLAAELLTAYHPPDISAKIIVTGEQSGNINKAGQYENSKGFEQYIEKNAPNVELLRAYSPNTRAAFLEIKSLIERNPDIYAVYSCSARHTIRMCEAVAAAKMVGKIKLIGNDCFEESVKLLRDGMLTAIIDKKNFTQGSLAMETLFNYVVKSEKPSDDVLYVSPRVVMRSNLDEG